MSDPEHMSSDRYDPSFWVRSQVNDLGARLADERTRPCEHLTDPERDHYSWALWAPAAIVCEDCLGPLLAAPAGMCDRCGDAAAAHQNDYRPTEQGDWVFLFRLCTRCQGAEMSQV